MKKDNLNILFKSLQGEFDLEAPALGHEKRFLSKLDKQQLAETRKPRNSFWKPLIGIAASLAILASIFIVSQKANTTNDLASISPEMAETQNFFTSTITAELAKLEKEISPETKLLIQDAMIQMQRLENEYKSLKDNLAESGNDKRVIYAMISNFQNRIDILEDTLKQIESIKQLKNSTNENII